MVGSGSEMKRKALSALTFWCLRTHLKVGNRRPRRELSPEPGRAALCSHTSTRQEQENESAA